MNFSALSQTGLIIHITPSLVFSILMLFGAIWIVYTLILRYHWKHYSTSLLEVLSMNTLYFVGSAIIFAGMALFASLFSL